MKRTLRLRREPLHELTSTDLASVHAGTNTWVTDGHHCFVSNLCALSLQTCETGVLCAQTDKTHV